jgi:hypothetical protein
LMFCVLCSGITAGPRFLLNRCWEHSHNPEP